MKNVILIGDSIRLGYEGDVREALAGEAEIWAPEQNGGHTVNVLMHLHTWVLPRQPDIVHVNAGLHDLKTVIYGEHDNLIPLSCYQQNVERIIRTIRAHTRAQVIWAMTTPINEAHAHAAHAQWQDFDRFADDVIAYNDAARAVCERNDVPINDLYSALMGVGPDTFLREDGVHFTTDGYRFLGNLVAEAIRAQL